MMGLLMNRENTSTLYSLWYGIKSSSHPSPQPLCEIHALQDLIPAKIQMNDDANLPYSLLCTFPLRTFDLIPESLKSPILFFRAPTIRTS
jgi:hypothetical protein